MKTSHIIGIAICMFTLSAATTVHAQEWEEGGEIESVEIEIVKDKVISLPRANRNFEKIPPRPAEPLKPAMTYDFTPFTYTAPDYQMDVKPLRVKQEEMAKIYAGYISAGVGNYSSPYLEASYTAKRDAEKYFGAEVYHKSYGKGPVEGKLSASGDTRVNLFGKMMGPKLTTGASFRYDNRFNHFYAPTGAPVETRTPDEILQTYNIGAIDAFIKNTKATDLNFKLGGAFSYLTDHYNAEESRTGVFLETDYKMKNEKALLFRMNYKLLARKDSLTEARPRHLLNVAPAYKMKLGSKATLTAGLNAVMENDTLTTGNFHVYPDVWLIFPAGKKIESYAALTGGFDEVSLHTLSASNSWVGPDLPLAHTNRALEMIIGARGTLGRNGSFDAGASVTRYRKLFFYENLSTDRTMFTATYDDATRANLFLQGGLAIASKGQMNLRGDYYSYATETIAHPWHRPQYKVGAYTSWTIAEKVMADLNLVMQGGAKAYDYELNTVVSLEPAIDVSARLRYFWSQRFSIFVEGSNLLNRKYPLYLHYQVRGVQVTGGLSFSF